jgi:hypothetical protein
VRQHQQILKRQQRLQRKEKENNRIGLVFLDQM